MVPPRPPRPRFRLVHDVNVDEESPTSSKSDPDTDCDTPGESAGATGVLDERGVGYEIRAPATVWRGPGERRRRKLPEIPKNKKCK